MFKGSVEVLGGAVGILLGLQVVVVGWGGAVTEKQLDIFMFPSQGHCPPAVKGLK
jgi:hypothetical protein